jgi:hypothetical protein
VGFQCGICGEQHEGLPLDIGFARPGDYLAVPRGQRERRCRFTNDVGIIDGRRYYIRGCLYVPVVDVGDFFAWGLWAQVSKETFDRYRELYSKDGSQEPPLPGRLSVEDKPGYEGLDGLAVQMQLRSAAERPAFRLEPCDHLLYREQQEGITLHRVQEMLQTLFPEQFGRSV